MGKIRKFLGFLTFLCVCTFGAHAFATPEIITLHWVPAYGDAPVDTTCEYGDTFNAPAASEVEGRQFTNWSTNGQNFSAGQTGIPCTWETLGVTVGEVTFTGNYDAISYTITYVLNGGANHKSNAYTYNIDSPKLELRTPTRAHSKFVNWYRDSDFSGTTVKYIYSGTTGDITVYAKWTCDANYNDDDNDNVCSLDTYNVTYSCGDGNGTPPSVDVATYSQTFRTAANTCSRSGWLFDGWSVSNTEDIRAEDKGFTWKYSENKTLTAHWIQTPGNCLKGAYYDSDAGTCKTCPDGYTSDLGADGINACYTVCLTNCINPGNNVNCRNVVDGVNNCTYQGNALVDGIEYYGSTMCTTTKICDYATISCQSNYYSSGETSYYNENGERNMTSLCLSCAESTTYYSFSTVNQNRSIYTCYAKTSYNCEKDREMLTPDLATCELLKGKETVNGYIYYDNPLEDAYVVKAPGISCAVTNCTCPTGYTFNPNTPSCDADTYAVTLNDNGGTGGVETLYENYNDKFTLTVNGNVAVYQITTPKKQNYVFTGYYNAETGGTIVIDSAGNLPAPTIFTSDTTLYAHWDLDVYYCTIGKNANNASCAGGFYCPGEEIVPSENKSNQTVGCERRCPTDIGGGTIASPSSSSNINDCYATRTGVSVADGTGGGTQVCRYVGDETSGAYTDCDSVVVTYCSGGYYLANTTDDFCTPVDTGYWSPSPMNNVSDNISLARYSCAMLPNANDATTSGQTSNTPEECYNNCADVILKDSTNNTIGTLVANPTTQNFVGNISEYDPINASVTTADAYPECTYDSPVCHDGYYVEGLTCQSNVYKITLNDTYAETNGVPATLYVKYGDGWYIDANATQPITTLSQNPTRTSYEFAGYTYNNTEVINANGQFVNNTFTTSDTSVTVAWVLGKIQCSAGYYYTGYGAQCTECLPNAYCPGGKYDMETGTPAGATSCPTGGKADAGAGDITACYNDTSVEYDTAQHGSGTSTCYYNSATSAYDICAKNTITQCDAGYYFNAELTTITKPDCSPVGPGYYSPAGSLIKMQCPDSHPLSFGDATPDIYHCYAETCPIAENATEMTGRNYYDTTLSGYCAIKFCMPGYYIKDGACIPCRAGFYCDGTAGGVGDGSTICPGMGDDFTDWVSSNTMSTKASDCYATCLQRDVTYGTAYPVSGLETVYYPNLCQFYGISETGNPCDKDELANGNCVESACSGAFEMKNGVCSPCNRDENAVTYEENGNCIVKTCKSGYHPNIYSCVENKQSCKTMIPNADEAFTEWDFTKKAFGTCNVSKCAGGYHIASNACVLDDQTCTVPHGIGTHEWDDTLGAWGPCIVTSCDAGYTSDPDEKLPGSSDQCGECKNKYVNGEQAVSSYVSGCEIASCMYQGEKFALKGDVCEPICMSNKWDTDDKLLSIGWNQGTKKCERKCKPGYIPY